MPKSEEKLEIIYPEEKQEYKLRRIEWRYLSNNLKQESKHLIIVKQYYETNFEYDFVKGKNDSKSDSIGRKKRAFGLFSFGWK